MSVSYCWLEDCVDYVGVDYYFLKIKKDSVGGGGG